MIAKLIAASSRNIMLVMIATVFAVVAGIYAILSYAARRHSRSLRYTSHRLHRIFWSGAASGRGSGHLSPYDRDADRPRSRVVRGFSYFGVSFVYVIFEDGTDIYWARSRVLEYLNAAARRLPSGVAPSLGPDATGVGWVYQYALLSKDHSLAELRTIQDFYVRYGLAKAEGVAEIASVGGFVKQYNVVIDPQRLRAFDIPLSKSARSGARQQHGCRRAHGRTLGVRIRRARTRLSQGYSRPAKDRPESPGRHAGACCRTWQGWKSGPTSAGA